MPLVKPAKTVMIKVFNEHVGIDIVFVHDIADHKYPLLGIIDMATLYHVVVRLISRAHCKC